METAKCPKCGYPLKKIEAQKISVHENKKNRKQVQILC